MGRYLDRLREEAATITEGITPWWTGPPTTAAT